MKSFFIFVAPLIVIILVIVGSFLWWNNAVSAPSSTASDKRILIKKGASAATIGQDLESKGVVKSSLAFKLYTQINNLTKKIPPGEFLVPTNLTLEEVVKLLIKGPREVWVTIPEGFRREEIADRLLESLELTGNEASLFRSEFLSLSANLEGYLFPDTYLFPKDVTPQAVINRVKTIFDQKKASELDEPLAQSKVSFSEAVIIASIIERETLTEGERPTVAGILLNRLEIGMPLQADATVQYAIGSKECVGKVGCDWWRVPTKEDLKLNSPFNTYLNPGLPPAPIANPGLVSLKAALAPEPSAYLYYIHDSYGKIHYATSLDEHNRNISLYLR